MAPSRGGNWWDATWNPVGGCKPASPGCKNCYAAKLAATQHTSRQVPLYFETADFRNEKPVFNGHLTVLPEEHPEWIWPLKYSGADRPLLGPGQPSLISRRKRIQHFVDRLRRSANSAATRHIGTICTEPFSWVASSRHLFGTCRSSTVLQPRVASRSCPAASAARSVLCRSRCNRPRGPFPGRSPWRVP